MHSTVRAEVPWIPATDAERAAVFRQMDRLLSSRHFRNSKRYPALLEYIIRETLAGNAELLKERVLGVAVFHRPPDYDANADPIVRVTAGEIRKRIAHFYYEEGVEDEIHIDLRPGSYVPEFYPAASGAAQENELPPGSNPLQISIPPKTTPGRRLSWKIAAPAIAVLALLVLALLVAGLLVSEFPRQSFLWQSRDQRTQMWYPFLNSSAPVLLVVGQPHASELENSSPRSAYEHGPASQLELADAIAMAHLCNILDAQHHLYQITVVSSTSLSDLRKGPAILVGGFNNPWSMRILQPLRFTLTSVANGGNDAAPQILQIADRKHQPGSPWTVDLRQPINAVAHDYAIIARFQANMTDGEVMVIAGLGPGGTESASKFVSSSAYMTQLATQAPSNWRGMNMEAVLETEVIGGRAGHPHIVAAEFW